MSTHPWEKIAKELEQETDPHKVAELSQKLTEAMIAEEREKVEYRLGIPRALFVLKRKPSGSR